MRTTLDIDDDLLDRVRARARSESKPVGAIVGEMLRSQFEQEKGHWETSEYGLPVWMNPPGTEVVITTEFVSQLQEETE
jgi:hypothetical protein